MWGLGAVIAREMPRLGTVLVDVDEPEPAGLARRLLGELASVGEPHVVWRGDVRRVARLEAHASAHQGALEIPPDRTFLVTGGMGALGLHCAAWLADQGARHLALLGRSAPSPAAQRRIDALTAQGVEVVVCVADVADRASLRSALERLRLAAPPLAGVLHAAGVLRDGALSAVEWEDVAQVLAPKVAGTWNLVEETERLALDFLVLFSSAAGVLGSPGQGAYAAANAFMDGVAHHLRARGRRAYSVDWGPWAGGGMATRTAASGRTAWSALGMIDVSPAQGTEILRRVLLGDEPQVVVLPIARESLARAFAGDRPPALFSELAAPGSGAASGQTEAPGAALLRSLDGAPEAARREQVERIVQEAIGRVLGRVDGATAHVEENLADIGMDSLMAMELNEKISAAFGRPLPPEVLLGAPSVLSIVDHLVGLDPAEGMAPAAALRGAPVEAPKPARRRPTVDERFAPKFDPILSELEAARGSGMYCFEKAVTGLDKQYVECADGQRRLMFATYNYLGLLGDPRIEAAATEAIRRYGTGTHGARLIAGTLDLHLALERKLAEIHRREAAILFSSGFMANYSTVPALVGPGDVVISDQLNHASLVDGCRASGATFRVFRHNDMANLERVLSEVPDDRRALVVADAIFSLDGDIFDLPMAVPLCREYGAMLMVDEAHSLGVLGAKGCGIEEHFDMVGTVDVLMGTLSKCVPASGGYIAGSARLVEYVRHAARGYIFSGATAPGNVAAALAGLEILEREGAHLRERLHANAKWFLERLRAAGFDTGRSCTPIIPVFVGSLENALALTHYCQQNGLYAVPAIPPSVAPGTSRLRLNVTAALSHDDIQAALDIIFGGARAVLGMDIPHDSR
jgi:8-amino-7-oxononanoate synthase